MKTEFIRKENDFIMVKFIGYCGSQHVGVSKEGKIYIYCYVNNRGYEYNYERDGKIEFE